MPKGPRNPAAKTAACGAPLAFGRKTRTRPASPEESKKIEIAAQAEEDDPPRKTSGKKSARKGSARKKLGKV